MVLVVDQLINGALLDCQRGEFQGFPGLTTPTLLDVSRESPLQIIHYGQMGGIGVYYFQPGSVCILFLVCPSLFPPPS